MPYVISLGRDLRPLALVLSLVEVNYDFADTDVSNWLQFFGMPIKYDRLG